jgi:hypothetical protein
MEESFDVLLDLRSLVDGHHASVAQKPRIVLIAVLSLGDNADGPPISVTVA